MKISFLFGAGVECGDNFNMPSGFEYLKRSLYPKKYHPKMFSALEKFNRNRNVDSYYPKYCKYTFDADNAILKSLVVNKSNADYSYFYANRAFVRYVLDDSDLMSVSCVNIKEDKHIGYVDYSSLVKSKPHNIRELKAFVQDVFTENIKEYDKLPSELKPLFGKKENCSENESDITLDISVSVGSELVRYFHTIINPEKYGTIQFSRIYNYYWSCYFTIVETLIANCRQYDERFEKYVSADGINYFEILDNIQNFTALLYDSKYLRIFSEKLTYYYFINCKLRENTDIKIGSVITTNYYNYSSVLKPEVIYLNGKLSQFEILRIFDVVDIVKQEAIPENEYFIPFIFGNTPVKPIVHSKQTEQYHLLFDALKKTDVLVVFGYGVNEDDNHINSFLREYVKRNKKRLIYVSNNAEDKVADKLKVENEEITLCKVCYEWDKREIVDAVFDSINKIRGKRRR